MLRSSLRHARPSRLVSLRSLSTSVRNERPFSLAIVGAGPAGFYAASRLLLNERAKLDVNIDMFEQLPVPYGLVRSGVAADHPEVKNCQHRFEEVAEHPNFRFYGNVRVTSAPSQNNLDESTASSTSPTSSSSSFSSLHHLSPVPHPEGGQIDIKELQKNYDSVLLTYGASLDRPLGLPHEESIPNVLSARSFVHWYNGYPFSKSNQDVPQIDLRNVKHVTIIGQGNVAIDCARILLSPQSRLAQTDIPQPILDHLKESNVQTVELVGRRGPLQLAATMAELRELINLQDTRFDVSSPYFDSLNEQGDHCASMLDQAAKLNSLFNDQGLRKRKRMIELLSKHHKALSNQSNQGNHRFGKLVFNQTPISWDGQPGKPVKNITWAINDLVSPDGVRFPLRGTENDQQQQMQISKEYPPSSWSAKPTDTHITTQTDLVLVSIGYRSVGIPGLPFDSRRGLVPNIEGKVIDTQNENKHVNDLYVAGWLATGPTGVLGTTMMNAFNVADQIRHDLLEKKSSLPDNDIPDPIKFIKPNMSIDQDQASLTIDWKGWTAIDSHERDLGAKLSKEREKITDIPAMLDIVEKSRW